MVCYLSTALYKGRAMTLEEVYNVLAPGEVRHTLEAWDTGAELGNLHMLVVIFFIGLRC